MLSISLEIKQTAESHSEPSTLIFYHISYSPITLLQSSNKISKSVKMKKSTSMICSHVYQLPWPLCDRRLIRSPAGWTVSPKSVCYHRNMCTIAIGQMTKPSFHIQNNTKYFTFGLGCRPMTRRTGPGGHLLRMVWTLLNAAWRTLTEFTSRIWSPRLGRAT